mgnify:CR=1 FL=1
MIGILINIAGHQRKLLSLTTSYSRTVCKWGYPDSFPITHFFKVSFLTEEGADIIADQIDENLNKQHFENKRNIFKDNRIVWKKLWFLQWEISFFYSDRYVQAFLEEWYTQQ